MNRSEEIRNLSGLSRVAFSKKYDIPLRTLENWDAGVKPPKDYTLNLLERAVREDARAKKRYSIINMSFEDYEKEERQALKGCYSFDYDYVATSDDKYEIAMILYRDHYDDSNACIEIYTVDDDGEFKEGSDVDSIDNFIKNIEMR